MNHTEEVVDQFTRQAQQFASSAGARSEEILEAILQLARPTRADRALDVACGPGVLACGMARYAGHVTGIDLTPAMLDQARKTQREQGVENVAWDLGDVTALPYGDASFDIVTCRFAFHHFSEPLVVLKEMHRVCRAGGRMVVADSAPSEAGAEAFNAMEKMRDPSHARAMPLNELRGLFLRVGFPEPKVVEMRLGLELESLLSRSYPREGDEARLRALFEQALIEDTLDIQPRREGEKLLFSFPVAVLGAQVANV
jgi:ubiquinone/menaquinone biosynthesis C-methylase UbiE